MMLLPSIKLVSLRGEGQLVSLRGEGHLVWNKKNATREDGMKYLELRLNNEVLQVPDEYVGQNPPDSDFFDVVVLWPGMQPASIRRNTDKIFDVIRIMFRSPHDASSFRDTYKILTEHIQRNEVTKQTISINGEELISFEHKAKIIYYQFFDELLKTPSGNPLIVYCTRQYQNSPLCYAGLSWSKELTIRYSVPYDQLMHISEIHKQVTNLIRSFIE